MGVGLLWLGQPRNKRERTYQSSSIVRREKIKRLTLQRRKKENLRTRLSRKQERKSSLRKTAHKSEKF
jgi:hypothetical protein